jgi:hypothetical protein
VNLAVIEWEDGAVWLGGPLVASLVLLICGILLRASDRRRLGRALILIGAGGLLLSIGWIALVLYVDRVVR